MTRTPTPAEPRLPDDLTAWDGRRPPMHGDELTQVELEGAVWSGLEAGGLRLDEVRARRVDLREAVLRDCRISDTVFAESNLWALELHGARCGAC